VIQANVREMLHRGDAELALALIAQGSRDEYEAAERRLRDFGIDAVLDDERLYPAILRSRQAAYASFPLFACVAARASMRKMGVHDPVLADYLAVLLIQFGLRDRHSRISDADDQTYDTAVDIAADLDDPSLTRSFLLRAHLGNYTLWLSGLFPDRIEYRRRNRGGPDLEYYEEMGRRGFALAADHRLAAQYNLADLFRKAAENFLMLRLTLNGISDTLLFPNVSSPERLMRQVSDEFRWKQG
jgi:hypothetical protein